MSAQPSHVALAIFDHLVPDNDPLRGDLAEEYQRRQSCRWLWRQVFWAAVFSGRSWLARQRDDWQMVAVRIVILLLLSFEAVLVVNLLSRMMFGPVLNIHGYYHTGQMWERIRMQPPPAWNVQMPLASVLLAIPFGWLIGRFHHAHYSLSLAAFSMAVMACAALNLNLPIALQFPTVILFILALFLGGRLRGSHPADAINGHGPVRLFCAV